MGSSCASNHGLFRHFRSLCLLLALAPLAASAQNVRIYVTNSAGDSVHVIDPATHKVVQVIKGVESAHGVTFSPDGARVYISNEHDSTLDVLDSKSGAVIKQIPLSSRPNNIAITRDGKRIVVAIAREPAALDIIDTVSMTRTKSIPMNGRLHNTYITPDDKYAVSGSVRSEFLNVVDLSTEQVAWEIKMKGGVRPITIETNPDGSTRRAIRAALGSERLLGGRFRAAPGSREDHATRPSRVVTHPPTASHRRPTASAWHPTARRCG